VVCGRDDPHTREWRRRWRLGARQARSEVKQEPPARSIASLSRQAAHTRSRLQSDSKVARRLVPATVCSSGRSISACWLRPSSAPFCRTYPPLARRRVQSVPSAAFLAALVRRSRRAANAAKKRKKRSCPSDRPRRRVHADQGETARSPWDGSSKGRAVPVDTLSASARSSGSSILCPLFHQAADPTPFAEGPIAQRVGRIQSQERHRARIGQCSRRDASRRGFNGLHD
jgi:hypothetical protein